MSRFLLLVWLVFPAPAGSQEAPPGRWWRWPRVAERLNLTEAQKHPLDDKFFANRRQLIELKGAVEREQLELQRLLEKDPVDEAAVTTQFKNLDADRDRDDGGGGGAGNGTGRRDGRKRWFRQ